MPYKDKTKRYEAIRKSVAKKPEHYKLLGLHNKRKASQRGYAIKRRYGITIDDYNNILVKQNNGCAICQKPAGKTKSGRCNLHVDHDHITGKIRGLLCARCNCLAGYIDKYGISFVRLVEAYIEKNS